jgi:hypothetical protein
MGGYTLAISEDLKLRNREPKIRAPDHIAVEWEEKTEG